MSTQPTSPTPAQPADIDLADTLTALSAAELDAITARRRTVLAPPLGPTTKTATRELNAPRIGLALSGGGVRSATFALGLMRGLAQSQDDTAGSPDAPPKTLAARALLGRLDYLSSVSGGGYTAGMYGRLVASYGLACTLRLMATSDSPVLSWLRRNGRYLTPAGSRDIGIAVVTFLRAWIAIHAEFMIACILLGMVVIAPHLWQHTFQLLKPEAWERWHTPWWTLSITFWVASAPGLLAGYWSARDEPDSAARGVFMDWRDSALVLIVTGFALYLLRVMVRDNNINPLQESLNWPAAGALALMSLVLGQLLVRGWLVLRQESYGLKVAKLRNWLTRSLRWAMLISLGLATLGALDRISWWLLETLLTQQHGRWFWGGAGVGGVALIALRALMQPLQKIAADSTSQVRHWGPQLLNAASLLGMLILTTGWLVVMQWLVFSPKPFQALVGMPAWLRAGLPASLWAVWVLLTAGNSQMANTSSLHSFYRARLNRAYLAVGNKARNFGPKPQSATGSARVSARVSAVNSCSADTPHANVTQVVDGDDLRLRAYRPELNGGPIHLVNTCLNQTRDDDSGLYNADRKGAAVTATWRGFEVGAKEFVAFKDSHDAGTLGRWVAVSGAAASPGAGAYTSRGLALLVYFLGVRLGHWMRAPRQRAQLRWLSYLSWRFLPKPMMLTCEASATFFGQDRPWWYLSDGGHFENSAVYPLIKRELDFIILSDASGDPDYEFGDLENLVRKARIDFGADIDFYSRSEAAALFTLSSNELTVLSPEHLANNHSSRGVLLARIRYRERAGPLDANGQPGKTFRPEGTLLVVKPNLHDALDVDLLAYAQKHTSFPHESTADQSFDEAQWESYHRLGEDFGCALHDSWLAQLPGWRSPARHPLKVAARLGAAKDSAQATKSEPLWRRSARAAAIGTTLGVGASGTLLLSLWQVQDQLQRTRADEQTEARQLFTEVSKGLQDFKGSCPIVAEHVVTQASLLLDLRDSASMRPLERAGVDRMFLRITDECRKTPDATPVCESASLRIKASLCAEATKLPSQNTVFNYWHPGNSVQDQVAQAKNTFESVTEHFRAIEHSTPVAGVVVSMDMPPAKTEGSAPDAPAPDLYREINTPIATAQAAIILGSLQPCLRGNVPTTLYVHIYDEASRVHTQKLRNALATNGKASVLVAPVENVSRSADVRQRPKPVPWPKPTFVLHDRDDAASRDCAKAISRHIGAPWVIGREVGREGGRPTGNASISEEGLVWYRDLPRSLQGQPGVIELWLPPTDTSVSGTDPGVKVSQNAHQTTQQN